MDHRIVWVHGIGHHEPGYSTSWRLAFDPFLHLSLDSYLEVCWDTIFRQAEAATLSAASEDTLALTPQEQLAEAELRTELVMLVLARESALRASAPATEDEEDEAVPGVLSDEASGVVEWSDVYGAEVGVLSVADWVLKANEYLGDFTRYLVSRNVRNAVKERFKEQLRPLAGHGQRIAVVAHSWGTVVAYDSLLDLEAEQPGLTVGALLTLGSPLWMVRRLIEDRTGRKPRQLGNWINIHARGDLIGSWLKPGFSVDRDYQTPNFGRVGPHSSYFVDGNLAVQRDIAAPLILGVRKGDHEP